MKTSKDVGLVVVGADLVGLVEAHTHLGSRRSAPTAVRGREPPPLLPRSLVRILPFLSSSDILVLISNCLYKHPRRFGARPHHHILFHEFITFGRDFGHISILLIFGLILAIFPM